MNPHRRVLVTAALYHGTNDGAVAVLPAMYIIERFRGTFFSPEDSTYYLQLGLLTAVAYLAPVFLQALFGYLGDRHRPRPMLALGIAIIGLANLIIAGLDSYLLLIAAVVLLRAGSSFYHPVGISWVSKLYRGHQVDRAMGFQSAFGDVGVIVAFLSTPLLATRLGWHLPFLLWGGLALASSAVGLLLTRGVEEKPSPLDAPPVHPWKLIRSIVIWIPPLAIGGAAYTITNNFGPVYLKATLGLQEQWADGLIALWLLVGVLAAYTFGHISRRVGRFNTLRYAYVVIGVVGFVLGFMPYLPVVVVALAAFGVALFVTYPALFAFVSEGVDLGNRGTTFGLVFAFQLGGGAAAAYASGLLSKAYGIQTPFVLMGALGLLTGLALTLALRTTAGRGADLRARASAQTVATAGLGGPGHSQGR